MSDQTRPTFEQIDAWGVTHPGHRRTENQDHFFVGALARGVTVNATSIVDGNPEVLHFQRMASLAIVADGVGSAGGGEEAARSAVRHLLASVSKFFHEAEFQESEDPDVFARLLNEAALAEHESLVVQAEKEEEGRTFATTLTLFLGLWPHAYLLQVGDSRCYLFKDGALRQITRDQTLAQELVDSKVLSQTDAERSRWAHVLSSAIGGEEAAPVVTRVTRDWGSVLLLCSDGLTKHVDDDLIRERLANMTSSRQAAEQLLQDALDGGGTDNITVVIGRTVK